MLADFDLIEEITVQPEDSGATKLVNVLLSDKNLPVSVQLYSYLLYSRKLF